MILGGYDRSKDEVTVEVTISDGARAEMFTAVLDTGFTGHLMIPQSVADDLQLPRAEDTPVILGDGRVSVLPTCEAEVEWLGKRRVVQAYITRRADALIGMKLLRGSLVTLELIPGGSITVERAG